jgi:SAM-dependent methyltransferase
MPSNFVAKGADGYEAIMGRWSRRLAAPFLDFSGVPSRGRVLDAGCGTGSLTLALAAHPDLAGIEALDFEENFVIALRRRTTDPRIRAQQGDVCALPYADEQFDGVYRFWCSTLFRSASSVAGNAARPAARRYGRGYGLGQLWRHAELAIVLGHDPCARAGSGR